MTEVAPAHAWCLPSLKPLMHLDTENWVPSFSCWLNTNTIHYIVIIMIIFSVDKYLHYVTVCWKMFHSSYVKQQIPFYRHSGEKLCLHLAVPRDSTRIKSFQIYSFSSIFFLVLQINSFTALFGAFFFELQKYHFAIKQHFEISMYQLEYRIN